jgi:5-methylcytosine-specific restriction endonuclease McrA
MRRNDQLATYTECQNCKKPLRLAPSTVQSGHGKYCSKECFKKSREVSLTCDACGGSFTRYQSAVSRYEGKNFCSRACTYNVRKRPGRISIKRQRYGSIEFLKARKEVIARDGICQICGVDNAVSVHHKNWRPYDNRLENLVLLCKSCHGRFKREEEWEDGKLRIMACSELRGNSQSAAEMSAPA